MIKGKEQYRVNQVASEIRAFKALKRFEENPDWRIYFLAFGHLPEPITTLKGVSSLQKGTILTLNTIKNVITQAIFRSSSITRRTCT